VALFEAGLEIELGGGAVGVDGVDGVEGDLCEGLGLGGVFEVGEVGEDGGDGEARGGSDVGRAFGPRRRTGGDGVGFRGLGDLKSGRRAFNT